MSGSALNPPFINRSLEKECRYAKYRTQQLQRRVTGNYGKNGGVREKIPDEKSYIKGVQMEK